MSESLESFEIRQEALAEQLSLKEQWEKRVKSLWDSHVLEILPETKKFGFVDIEGRECSLPSFDEIKKMITPEKAEILETKIAQGFTRLHLVPQTVPLETLIAKYKSLLLQKHKEGKLLSTKGDQLPLNPDDPLYVWESYVGADTKDEPNKGMVYWPKQFDQTNHQGQSKRELIANGMNWNIELIEDLPDLPAEGKGEEINQKRGLATDRIPLEANHTSGEYLQTLQNDPNYQNEQGFTIEDWLTYAIYKLEEENIQIDDWSGQGKGCFNIASYFPADSDVSRCGFLRGGSQAGLDGGDPGGSNGTVAARSSVKINP